MRRPVGLVGALICLGALAAMWALWPTKIGNLALSFQGGRRLTVQLEEGLSHEARNEIGVILRDRFEAFGLTGARALFTDRKDQLEIEAPGLGEGETAQIKSLLAPGALSMSLVVETGSGQSGAELEATVARLWQERRSGRAAAADEPYDFALLSQSVGPGEDPRSIDPQNRPGAFILVERGGVAGGDLERVSPETTANGAPGVRLRLTAEGGRRMFALTSAAQGRTVAVILDGLVLHQASIQTPIRRDAVIEAGLSEAEIRALAGVIAGGTLPSKVELVSETAVAAESGTVVGRLLVLSSPCLLLPLTIVFGVLAAWPKRQRKPGG